ncbi:BhlA/UviB family holin-like peptide [Lysinibacillus sp. NPDC093712]|uniref:BhlA/UviB family holin-like peptide n=1 Tax=Lysinibacillus sp. NPDC093712 TaxID=3390579 RepID=UPI003D08344C
MDAKFLSDIATSQAVWAICCILLVGFILKKVYEKNDKQEDRLIVLHDEYRTESKERENKLMEHLKRSDEAQERTANSLEGINNSLNKLEVRVDRIEKNSFKNGDV